jgi:hypothetical protein
MTLAWSLGRGYLRPYRRAAGSVHLGPGCFQTAEMNWDGPGPPTAMRMAVGTSAFLETGWLGRELKTTELRSCFYTPETY